MKSVSSRSYPVRERTARRNDTFNPLCVGVSNVGGIFVHNRREGRLGQKSTGRPGRPLRRPFDQAAERLPQKRTKPWFSRSLCKSCSPWSHTRKCRKYYL